MEILVLVILVASASCVVAASDVRTCHTDADCEAWECCGIPSSEPWVSRRRQIAPLTILPTPPLPTPIPTDPPGTCKPLKSENETCSGYDEMMGQCPCRQDLTCFSFELPDGTLTIENFWVQTRPGYSHYSQCWTDEQVKAYIPPPDIELPTPYPLNK